MMTTSHAFFTYALTPAGPALAQAVVGSVLPDIPFWLGPPVYAVRRRGWQGSLAATRDGRVTGWLLRCGHSLVLWALAAVLIGLSAPGWLPLIWGWLGHLVTDFATHHGEPHAHFYPLSAWRFASPVSYYEWDHHAVAFMTGEALVAAVILAGWVRHEPPVAAAGWLVTQPWLWPLAGAAVLAAGRTGRREDGAASRIRLPPAVETAPARIPSGTGVAGGKPS